MEVAHKPKMFERPSICLSVRQHLPWVSCERNSSYSFLLIFLKLCRCFLHGVMDGWMDGWMDG